MKRESGLTALDNEITCAAKKISIISFVRGKQVYSLDGKLNFILLFETLRNWMELNRYEVVKKKQSAQKMMCSVFKWLYKCIHCRRVCDMWHVSLSILDYSLYTIYRHSWLYYNNIRMDWNMFVLVFFLYQKTNNEPEKCWYRQTIIFFYDNIINTKKFFDDWVCIQPVTSVNLIFVVYARKW